MSKKLLSTLCVVTAAGGLGLNAGDVVSLTASQARDRAGSIVPADTDDKSAHRVYKVARAVFFKRGERLGIVGKIIPAVAQRLEDAASGKPLPDVLNAAAAAAAVAAAGKKKNAAAEVEK